MNYKKAFTLVELLIVISIISMLGSIIIATTTSVQAKGRDAKRTQQIRQIDLATRLYIDTMGHAPYLSGCQIDELGTPSSASGCVAVSTAVAGTPEALAWIEFTNELKSGGFISDVPNDPCTSGCTSALGGSIGVGYTYVAPLAVQYFCSLSGTCTATNDSYQVYAPLEQTVAVAGSSGSSAADYYFVNPGGPDVTPPTVPTNVTAVVAENGDIIVSWDASTDAGSGVAGYEFTAPGLGGLITGTTRTIPANISYAGYEFCYSIVAIDVAGNISGPSIQACVTVPVTYLLTTPTNLASGVSPYPGYTRLSWTPSTGPEGVGPIDYRVSINDGPTSSTYNNAFADVTQPAPYCWTVYAVDDSNGWSSAISPQSCVNP